MFHAQKHLFNDITGIIIWWTYFNKAALV